MKKGRIQVKDIPTLPILQQLARRNGRWHTVWNCSNECPADTCCDCERTMPSLCHVMPGLDYRLRTAKMASLKRLGLVDGCECGCRGDWHILDKGLAELHATAAP